MIFWPLVALGVGGLLLWFARTLIAQGKAEAKAERAEKDLKVAKKQAEIMAQHKGVDDVSDDLERGDF